MTQCASPCFQVALSFYTTDPSEQTLLAGPHGDAGPALNLSNVRHSATCNPWCASHADEYGFKTHWVERCSWPHLQCAGCAECASEPGAVAFAFATADARAPRDEALVCKQRADDLDLGLIAERCELSAALSNGEVAPQLCVITMAEEATPRDIDAWVDNVHAQQMRSPWQLVFASTSGPLIETVARKFIERPSPPDGITQPKLDLLHLSRHPGRFETLDLIINDGTTANSVAVWDINEWKRPEALQLKLDALDAHPDVEAVSSARLSSVQESAGSLPSPGNAEEPLGPGGAGGADGGTFTDTSSTEKGGTTSSAGGIGTSSTSPSVDFNIDMNILGNATDFDQTEFRSNFASAVGNDVTADNVTLDVLDLTTQNLPESKRYMLKGKSSGLEAAIHVTVTVKTDEAHSTGVSAQLQQLANNVSFASEKVDETVESAFFYPTITVGSLTTGTTTDGGTYTEGMSFSLGSGEFVGGGSGKSGAGDAIFGANDGCYLALSDLVSARGTMRSGRFMWRRSIHEQSVVGNFSNVRLHDVGPAAKPRATVKAHSDWYFLVRLMLERKRVWQMPQMLEADTANGTQTAELGLPEADISSEPDDAALTRDRNTLQRIEQLGLYNDDVQGRRRVAMVVDTKPDVAFGADVRLRQILQWMSHNGHRVTLVYRGASKGARIDSPKPDDEQDYLVVQNWAEELGMQVLLDDTDLTNFTQRLKLDQGRGEPSFDVALCDAGIFLQTERRLGKPSRDILNVSKLADTMRGLLVKHSPRTQVVLLGPDVPTSDCPRPMGVECSQGGLIAGLGEPLVLKEGSACRAGSSSMQQLRDALRHERLACHGGSHVSQTHQGRQVGNEALKTLFPGAQALVALSPNAACEAAAAMPRLDDECIDEQHLT